MGALHQDRFLNRRSLDSSWGLRFLGLTLVELDDSKPASEHACRLFVGVASITPIAEDLTIATVLVLDESRPLTFASLAGDEGIPIVHGLGEAE